MNTVGQPTRWSSVEVTWGRLVLHSISDISPLNIVYCKILFVVRLVYCTDSNVGTIVNKKPKPRTTVCLRIKNGCVTWRSDKIFDRPHPALIHDSFYHIVTSLTSQFLLPQETGVLKSHTQTMEKWAWHHSHIKLYLNHGNLDETQSLTQSQTKRII